MGSVSKLQARRLLSNHFKLVVSIFFLLNVWIFDPTSCSKESLKLLLSESPPENPILQNLVDIFTFQKNEGTLLLEWGAWHGSIFGFDALHIIDHQSDDPQTILYLDLLASKGVHVMQYSGKFERKSVQLTHWMATSGAKFLVPIDVDEFLVLIQNGSLVLDNNKILSTFHHLPTDGRRYRMKRIDAIYCPGNNTNNRPRSSFSRAQEMTVFQQAPPHLNCKAKTFYLRSAFLEADQGNHHGTVATDAHDGDYKVTTLGTGCPYFHSPDIGLVHFGQFLPWNIRRDKMIRGAQAYNHTVRVETGQGCPPPAPVGPGGLHYCLFWKKFLEIGEQAMQAEYEKNSPCASKSVFASQIISDRIGVALSRMNVNRGE
jgi:hypothetical protein